MPRYAISDIHGCNQTFLALLEQIRFSKEDELFLLGDYIDRGPDSKGVIDTIWRLQAEGHTVHCLRGNHEQMAINGMRKGEDHVGHWLRNGGGATLASFGDNLEEAYVKWMEDLPYYLESPGYILVHAGFDFFGPPLENKKAMIWERYWYDSIDYEWLGDRIILHGHTPISWTEIEQMRDQISIHQVLDIDAGCVFTRERYERLCAFDMDRRELTFVLRVEEM